MKKDFPIYDICKLSDYKQDDVLISRFGDYLQTHHDLHFPHKHNFYHLVLFTKGAGSHTIDFKPFEVEPYQIYFMTPGQVHSWSFEGDVDGYLVHFSTEFFPSFLLAGDYLHHFPFFNGDIDDAVINLTTDARPKVIGLFEDLIGEAEAPDRMNTDMIRLLLLQIFITLSRMEGSHAAKKLSVYNYTLIKSFRRLIEKNYTKLRLPKEYAELLYITPNHLNAVSNDVLGMPAGEAIRNRVLLEAKRLLINRDMSISEIAYQLNFNDNSYFTKFFKNYTDLTPEEFRRNTLN
jgi:AraC family transcriptional activator of pobA